MRCGRGCTANLQEEILEKYTAEKAKKGACKGGREPFKWRRSECSFQRNKSMQAGRTEEEGSPRERQSMRKMRATGRMDAHYSWWVSDLLAADCKQKMAPPRMERHFAAVVQLAA